MSVIWDVRDGELVTVQSPYKEAREQASWWENIFSLIKSGTETWDTLVQSGLIKPKPETALPTVGGKMEKVYDIWVEYSIPFSVLWVPGVTWRHHAKVKKQLDDVRIKQIWISTDRKSPIQLIAIFKNGKRNTTRKGKKRAC